MSEHVLIVGGSVAGLALAASLDPRRVRVTLVEERPERAVGGTLLALWPGTLADLDRLGIGDEVRDAGFPEQYVTLRDVQGRVLTRRRVPRLLFTPRAALIAALDAAVPTGVERLTHQVHEPRTLADELDAGLVVGADGVRSICRRTAFPGSEPVVTDWVALRGHLARPHEATSEWWGPGGLFGLTPGPQGSAWFCAVRADGRSLQVEQQDVLDRATGHFADWDPALGEILATAGRDADAQRILTAPPLRRVVDGSLVLIGDAAHAMTPNLGRGASEAIRDAAVLAQMVHRHGTKGTPDAYARRRHLIGQGLRVGASLAMRSVTSARLTPLREGVLRLLPG